MNKLLLFCLLIFIPISTFAEDALEWYAKGKASYDNKEKIVFFTKAIELKPDFKEALLELADLENDEGIYEKALEHLNKYIDLDDSNPKAYVERACAKYNLGNSEGHNQDCLQAIKVDSKCEEAYYRLGYVYENQEEHDTALSYYNKAIEIYPEYECAIEGRTRIKDLLYRKRMENNYEDQQKKYAELLKISEGQQQRQSELFDKAEEQQSRFDKILETWEIQQKEYQKYLDILKNKDN